MEAKHSAGISPSDLAQSTKALKAAKTCEHTDSFEYDPEVADRLAVLYKKYDGDVRAIFEDLDESPRKALKHPPSCAADFGKKYAQGFYTYADEK